MKTALMIVVAIAAVALFVLLSSTSSSSPNGAKSESKATVPPQQQPQLVLPSAATAASLGDADTQYSPCGKCITYEERYRHCINLKKQNSPAGLKSYFDRLHERQASRSVNFTDGNKEVVLLRMHRKAWPLDFWLFVCSFVIEASANGKRDVFLYTLDGHENSIPPEFANYVRVHPETELARIFRNLPYSGGYMRGDLAAALFLKQNPQYGFVWMIESDVRYVGSWDQFFSDSMTESKLARNYVPTTPNNGEGDRGKDADLIWWYPRMLNYGYDIKRENDPRVDNKRFLQLFNAIWEVAQSPVPAQPELIQNVHLFSMRRKMRGRWFWIFNNTMWVSAFVPAFGASRRLLIADYDMSLRGDSNENQEAAMPLIAQLFDFKIVSLAGIPKFPLQFYFGMKRKDREGRPESAPLYVTWMNGEPAARDQTEYNSYGLKAFEGKRCLANTVFHPVKY